MRILVLGAGGFVGRHIVSELLDSGHVPAGAVPRPVDFASAFPGVAALPCDLARDISAADWLARLEGIDVVVNAAGVLSGAEMDAVHVTALTTPLLCACGSRSAGRLSSACFSCSG